MKCRVVDYEAAHGQPRGARWARLGAAFFCSMPVLIRRAAKAKVSIRPPEYKPPTGGHTPISDGMCASSCAGRITGFFASAFASELLNTRPYRAGCTPRGHTTPSSVNDVVVINKCNFDRDQFFLTATDTAFWEA